MIERQYPQEPVPIDATYNGYKTSELDIRLVLAFFGRLFISLDDFQMFIGIFGFSGVGKTVIIEFFSSFFGSDIFNLKNNPEQQFGWMNSIGARLCIIEEASSDSQIPPDMILSMACRSKRLPVSRKGLSQIDLPFNMPVLMTGNSFPSSWPDEAKQMTRRSFIGFWDRPLPKHKINQNLPKDLEDERGYIIQLCLRAYHSLVRVLDNRHVNEIMTKDLERDAQEVIAGTDDITDFLRNCGMISYDKGGINSNKRLPIAVLKNEWVMYKKNKYGSKSSKSLTKKEFNRILDFTGAAVLIHNKIESKSGPSSTFNVPRYEGVWPPLCGTEYSIGSKVYTFSNTKGPKAFVCGISLNLADCPRLVPEGSSAQDGSGDGNFSSYNGSSSSSSSSSAAGDNTNFNSRMSKYMNGDFSLMNAQEKRAGKVFTASVKQSFSCTERASVSSDSKRESKRKPFKVVRNGGGVCDYDEFKDSVDDVFNDGSLSRWELSVLADFFNKFEFVIDEDIHGNESDPRVALLYGVSSAVASSYVTNDLRTVKLALQLRGASPIILENIKKLYDSAKTVIFYGTV
jgi:hypothetical protein